MSKQDKATTDKFARKLRDLVKKPDNKICADCKRNDPRWASWNLGVFLCIRCSGIHRGMGTHISKVKSVDLDVWTPEQMESIQKWGNHLANLYWEAHLKPGHLPPEHKIESFIRSKYESRRWALDGPPPSDPSVLDSAGGVSIALPSQTSSPPQRASSVPLTTAPPVNRQSVVHQLLSANYTNNSISTPSVQAQLPASNPPITAQKLQAKALENDLFSLDFRTPLAASVSPAEPQRDVKQDILSLFSSAPAPTFLPATQQSSTPNWGGTSIQQQQPLPSSQATTTGMTSTSSMGIWGTSSGSTGTNLSFPSTHSNNWSTPAASTIQHSSILDTNTIWSTSGSGINAEPQQKKNDAFEDIWGGFK